MPPIIEENRGGKDGVAISNIRRAVATAAYEHKHRDQKLAEAEEAVEGSPGSVGRLELRTGTTGEPSSRASSSPEKRPWSFLRQRVQSFGLHDHRNNENVDVRKWGHHKFFFIREAIQIKLWECVLAILAYLVIGVIAYSFLFERWAIVDSLYFSVVTFTTVGYGDLYPSTTAGRIFTCAFGLGGICFLGVALGVIGNNLVSSEVTAIERARGINRQKIISYFEALPSAPISDDEPRGDASDATSTTRNKGIKEFVVAHIYPVIKSLRTILAILLASFVFAWVEGWSLIDAVYFCVVTATTIGYGDMSPETAAMRWYSLIFIPVAVGVVGVIIGRVAELVIDKRKQKALDQIMDHDITLEDLELMHSRRDGTVSKSEYLEFMLVAMNVVNRDLLQRLRDQFDRMDVDSNGFLARRDLELRAAQRRQEWRHKLALANYKYDLTSGAKKVATYENILLEVANK